MVLEKQICQYSEVDSSFKQKKISKFTYIKIYMYSNFNSILPGILYVLVYICMY